ncbi:MAG TPA: sigma-70 family RNA polymerase sigma factor [Clostridia bacterium]|nr:sigma-70 family RNA polymerase sigma factor [Clostridia bacterium]
MTDPVKSRTDDEELVRLACKGDNNAMARLISGIVPLVKARAATFAGKNLECEDLAQEGMLGFLSAVYSYKPGGEAAFRTYAATCINNRIISAVRSQLSGKNMPLNFSLPFREDESDLHDRRADPQDILSAQEETERLLRILNEKLSTFERAVFQQRLAGKSYEQTAEVLHTTVKAVDNALQRAKKKLKSTET